MRLDVDAIRRHLDDAGASPESLEVFAEIESTNSYLMQQPPPSAGRVSVAATDNQTAGRGRYGRRWQSPPGSGLCLSLAYTFNAKPDNLPAITLAVGLGVIDALEKHGVNDVQLKWPNDLIAANCKLGGILTEAHNHAQPGSVPTVVTGIGLNVDLARHAGLLSHEERAQRITDLRSHAGVVPDRNGLAASLVSGLCRLMCEYDARGFEAFRDQWQERDWLRGRSVAIETPQQSVSGIGVGVADNGALMVATASSGIQHVTSGTVTMAEPGQSGV